MNKLSSFYQKRIDEFLAHLNDAKSLEEEKIHRLRVDIKNIRSLLLLIEALKLDTVVVEKLLKQLRPVFKYSGRLRTIQVCKALINEGGVDNQEEIVKTLEENKLKISEDLTLSLNKFKLDKFQDRISILYQALESIPMVELRQRADKIIQDELDLIFKLWSSSRGEEYYHDIRKFFKIIKSMLQLLIEVERTEILEQEYKIVNETETILGNWHDREILDKKLSKIQKTAPSSDFKSLVREIKNKNRGEKNNYVKDFKQQMHTSFFKH